MKRIVSPLLTLSLLASLGALFVGLMWQNMVLYDELASAFRLTEKVVHARRVFGTLLMLMFMLSLFVVTWNAILINKIRKLKHTEQNDGQISSESALSDELSS